jgi:iron complex transport system substrate-binding protein
MAPSSPQLRIVSLLPAATEIAAALGLTDALVGRSHECDEPPAVASLPALTAPRIDASASSRRIHEQVEAATAMFSLDAEQLAALAPDIVLTQAACDVCAVAAADVTAAVHRAARPAGASGSHPAGVPATPPRIVSLAGTTLEGVFADILAVGAATGRLARAREVMARLRARCDSVACRTTQLAGRHRPRVAMIEWLDPPMAAGNWVPELVRLAGGDDVLGRPGAHSHWISWPDVAAAKPDVVVLVPCGFTLERVVAEAAAVGLGDGSGLSVTECPTHGGTVGHGVPDPRGTSSVTECPTHGAQVWAVDGHHLFNRPGPRLVDSLEVLAEILHPGQFSFAATRRFARRLA